VRHQTQLPRNKAESPSPVCPPRPARHNPADLRSQAEALLHEMAYVYQLTRAVRKAMTNAAPRCCSACPA
jgi:hypothetical protein